MGCLVCVGAYYPDFTVYMGMANKPGLSTTHCHTIVHSLKLAAISKEMPTLKVHLVACRFGSLAPGCCLSTLLQSEREKCVRHVKNFS